MSEYSFDEMMGKVGDSLGVSEWVTIDQETINEFANCTGDHQWIHVDIERAKRESPFGGPVAHGYLTLSLVASLLTNMGIAPKGTAAALNYGLDKVRFLAPVPAGSKVRLHVKLVSFDQKAPGQFLMKTENTMEIDGIEKPALMAESLAMLMAAPSS